MKTKKIIKKKVLRENFVGIVRLESLKWRFKGFLDLAIIVFHRKIQEIYDKKPPPQKSVTACSSYNFFEFNYSKTPTLAKILEKNLKISPRNF